MNVRANQCIKWIGALLVFGFCAYAAFNISIVNAPDEGARILVPKFIVEHGHLPFGNEAEIRIPIWGFSYAYTPYLPSLFSALFIKIGLTFSENSAVLLFCARLSNVLAASVTWVFCIKIGERIFNHMTTATLLGVLVCFLPQTVFLFSYLNNDAFCVMSAALIIYCWIEVHQDGWSYKNCIFLGVSLGVCALSYYNAYGFILCSIVFYFIDTVQKKMSLKEIFIKAIVIFASACVLAGWFFIRNLVLHGDLLGMSAMNMEGEKYAIDAYKPSLRATPEHMGQNIVGTFFEPPFSWFKTSWKSFIGVFGYMSCFLPKVVYTIYSVIILIGIICICLRKITKNNTDIFIRNLTVNLLLCIGIPLVLSMYYSFSSDWQPQGRYLISALVPLMLFVSLGYEWIAEKIRVGLINIQHILIAIWLCLFVYAYVGFIIPNCCC